MHFRAASVEYFRDGGLNAARTLNLDKILTFYVTGDARITYYRSSGVSRKTNRNRRFSFQFRVNKTYTYRVYSIKLSVRLRIPRWIGIMSISYHRYRTSIGSDPIPITDIFRKSQINARIYAGWKGMYDAYFWDDIWLFNRKREGMD